VLARERGEAPGYADRARTNAKSTRAEGYGSHGLASCSSGCLT